MITTDCFIASHSNLKKTGNGLRDLLKFSDSEEKIAEGGQRLLGLFKANADEKPLVTVVTVVYNGVEYIEETIISVIEQEYDNVEYIIIDGGSTDGTLEVIKKYEYALDYWVSEPDKGIFDAMNKGIDLGAGEWISFMNAGDCFFDVGVLSRVFSKVSESNGFDIIYGDHEIRYPSRKKIVKAGNVKNLWKGSQFCHQSAFVRLSYHKKEKFNLERRIVADFEFFYKSSCAGTKMRYQPYVFSIVSSGGVSDVRRLESIAERYLCLDKKISVKFFYAFLYLFEAVKVIIKTCVRNIFR